MIGLVFGPRRRRRKAGRKERAEAGGELKEAATRRRSTVDLVDASCSFTRIMLVIECLSVLSLDAHTLLASALSDCLLFFVELLLFAFTCRFFTAIRGFFPLSFF